MVVLKIGMAVFELLESKIMNTDFENGMFLIRNYTFSLDEKLLLKKILSYNIKEKIFKIKFNNIIKNSTDNELLEFF